MKVISDMEVCRVDRYGVKAGNPKAARIILTRTDGSKMNDVFPGQFVNVDVPQVKGSILRRPISVCDVSEDGKYLTLLIQNAGKGTAALCGIEEGARLNIVYPLGNGFPREELQGKKYLLIGGGVGVAPLLYYGKYLKKNGCEAVYLLGARSAEDVLLPGEFSEVAPTCCMTEDGSLGLKGRVTDNPILKDKTFDAWVTCGPLPMMKAVAKMAMESGTECFVSLENKMACGLGACLCCVEKSVYGNLCACTAGPVFNIKELTW